MTKRWVLKEATDNTIMQLLSAELNINPILSALLVRRGVTNFAEAKQFFRPSYLHLHDPFLMKDMEKAITRIERAITDNEKNTNLRRL